MTLESRNRCLVLFLAAVLALAVPAHAQSGSDPAAAPTGSEQSDDPEGQENQPEQESDEIDVEELQRQLDVLAEEVERLRSGEEETVELTPEEVRALGLAPSAARTYQQTRGVSIAGYGEALFENYSRSTQAGRPSGRTDQFDFLRAIIYAGYRFNDKFLFNSEIEVEHADEIFIEFAYIDYLVHENLGIRGGMLLVPMGLVNEFHEPTVFLGTERPVTEQRIIPSTWRENGAGVHGSRGMFSYRAYIVNGLNGEAFSANGVRGGRQKGSRAKAENFAFTGRLDVTPIPGVFVGASVYNGGSGQGDIVIDGESFDVSTTVFDVHGQAQVRGFDVRGLFATASIGDAVELNQVLGNTGGAAVGDEMRGGYLQLGYDVLSQSYAAGGAQLTPYYRWERVDTQASVPTGFVRSLSTDATFHTVGVEVKPIPNVVVKLDHTWVSNDAESAINQWNIALGYVF